MRDVHKDTGIVFQIYPLFKRLKRNFLDSLNHILIRCIFKNAFTIPLTENLGTFSFFLMLLMMRTPDVSHTLTF